MGEMKSQWGKMWEETTPNLEEEWVPPTPMISWLEQIVGFFLLW